ncbi:MAG: hypothetical protein K9N23_10650 [Akkermansiaceae bacterium]|nr:hypothetical protein [Akkermansiaceae bacterium]MCF7732140.1 hypothetical protein [Akkermansiaceae bacterium]
MRTTLTIDDDLAGILKRKARELDKPFKELVNTALRKGLAASLVDVPQCIAVRPHDFGNTRPGIASDGFNQLMDELEVEDYLRKAGQDDSTGR